MKKARQILNSVLERHPNHGPSLLLLGRIILSTAQPAEAEGTLRKAAEVLPFDYQAQFQLGQCLSRQEGKSAEAQSQLAHADKLLKHHERMTEITTRLSVRPHDASLHYEMGILLMQLGNKDLGAKWLGSALQEKPDYPEARDALIAYLREVGDTQAADQLRDGTQ